MGGHTGMRKSENLRTGGFVSITMIDSHPVCVAEAAPAGQNPPLVALTLPFAKWGLGGFRSRTKLPAAFFSILQRNLAHGRLPENFRQAPRRQHPLTPD